jgi:hypothetical protein
MEVAFNYSGAPIGGKITVYLLEKVPKLTTKVTLL